MKNKNLKNIVNVVAVRGAKARPFGANVQLDDERVRVRLGYIGVGLMYFIIKSRILFYFCSVFFFLFLFLLCIQFSLLYRIFFLMVCMFVYIESIIPPINGFNTFYRDAPFDLYVTDKS